MNEEITSIHEAGHAVTSCYFNVPFTYAKLGLVWVDSQGEPIEGQLDRIRDPDGAGAVYYAPHQRLNVRLEGLDWNSGMERIHEVVTIEAAILLAARVAIERGGFAVQESHFSDDDVHVEQIFDHYNLNQSLTLPQFREKILAGLRQLFARPCIWEAVVETSHKLLLANWTEDHVSWETINVIVEPCKGPQ